MSLSRICRLPQTHHTHHTHAQTHTHALTPNAHIRTTNHLTTTLDTTYVVSHNLYHLSHTIYHLPIITYHIYTTLYIGTYVQNLFFSLICKSYIFWGVFFHVRKGWLPYHALCEQESTEHEVCCIKKFIKLIYT